MKRSDSYDQGLVLTDDPNQQVKLSKSPPSFVSHFWKDNQDTESSTSSDSSDSNDEDDYVTRVQNALAINDSTTLDDFEQLTRQLRNNQFLKIIQVLVDNNRYYFLIEQNGQNSIVTCRDKQRIAYFLHEKKIVKLKESSYLEYIIAKTEEKEYLVHVTFSEPAKLLTSMPAKSTNRNGYYG